MFNLIIKDFLIQKKSILFSLAYTVFVLLFFYNRGFNQPIYIMAASAVSYLLLQGASHADDKNNSAIILNSLPVNRMHIVLAKYLTLAVYLAAGLIMTGLIGRILSMGINFPVRAINSVDITVSVLSVGLMGSIYLPLLFKFGNNVTRFVNVALFMLTFFVPGMLMGYLKNQPSGIGRQILDILQSVPSWSVMLGTVAATLAVVAVSLAISLKIYNNKDLC